MFYSLLTLFLSLLSTGAIYYFFGLYKNWIWFWVIIVGVPVFYVLWFLIFLVVLYLASLTIDKTKEVKKPSRNSEFICQQICFELLFLFGVIIKKSNFGSVKMKRKYMIVYNHTSNFDPMIIMSRFPTNLVCITKPENKKLPLVGSFIHKAGFISIDRDNDEEGIKSIMKSIDISNQYNYSICVSPEGTRSKDGKLLPFRPGCFNIAKRANMPILVIGLKNTNQIHKNYLRRITKVNFDVLGTIEAEECLQLSTVDLSNKIHKMYETYLED